MLNQYIKPFDTLYWANIKSKQLNISPDELICQWKYKADVSKLKGTIVHSYIESLLNDKNFEYPSEQINLLFGNDPVLSPFDNIKNIINQFVIDIKDKMIPIASEFIIGDEEYGVCGTIDQIFFNKKSNQLEIWDWKTNKEIKIESKYFHIDSLSHIPDTELDHYSLQLALYKEIITKNTGIEFGNSYICWFNENQDTYKIFKTKQYLKEVRLILDKYMFLNSKMQLRI